MLSLAVADSGAPVQHLALIRHRFHSMPLTSPTNLMADSSVIKVARPLILRFSSASSPYSPSGSESLRASVSHSLLITRTNWLELMPAEATISVHRSFKSLSFGGPSSSYERMVTATFALFPAANVTKSSSSNMKKSVPFTLAIRSRIMRASVNRRCMTRNFGDSGMKKKVAMRERTWRMKPISSNQSQCFEMHWK